MHMPDPVFPPLLTGHDVKGAREPYGTAREGAAEGRLGAGDVVWSRSALKLDLAIVLEPDVPFATATQMLPVAMVAAGDCIGSLTPPQVGVTFTWPNVLRINGAVAGEVRAAVAGDPTPETVPDWMVLNLWLRHRRTKSDPEPGEVPDITWLAEEGGDELTRTDLIESYCRHLLTWINAWQEEGFRAAHDSWLYRAAEHDGKFATTDADGHTITGAFLGLDEGGNLLLKEQSGTVRSLALADYFERHGRAP